MNYLVSFGTDRFLASQKWLTNSALRNGIDKVVAWDRVLLEQTSFYERNKSILDQRRGAGFWLWKPFIIEDALTTLSPRDVLVYLDAGIEVIADLSPLLRLCTEKNGLLLFSGAGLCGEWTKRDCFVGMNCDDTNYRYGRMLSAAMIVVAKTERSCSFIHEWSLCCRQPRLLTDQANTCGLPNFSEFIDHRHDQSILSLIAIRDWIEVFRDPSQFGNHLKDESYRVPGEWTVMPYGMRGIFRNSPYPTLLNHHRLQGAFAADEPKPL